MFYHNLNPKTDWGPWEKKFLWLPKKIVLNDVQTQTSLSKWMWLETIYIRSKVKFYYSADTNATFRIYDYAKDLFDVIKKT